MGLISVCVCVCVCLPLFLLPHCPSSPSLFTTLFHTFILPSFHLTFIHLFYYSLSIPSHSLFPSLSFPPYPCLLTLSTLSFLQGNYDNFKEQEAVKQHQQQKLWEKQEKKLREMKGKGVSKENAEKAQLKAKAREPGKIFCAFLLTLHSSLPHSFLPPSFISLQFLFLPSLSFSHFYFPAFLSTYFTFLPYFPLLLLRIFTCVTSLSSPPLFPLVSSTHLITSLHSLGARAKKAEAAAASSGGLESGESKVELIKRPRDYAVTFSFPEVTHSVSSFSSSSCIFNSFLLFISLSFIYRHFYFLLFPSLLIVPLFFLSLLIPFLLSPILFYNHLLFSPLFLLSPYHPI
jgi:hypothetical protein